MKAIKGVVGVAAGVLLARVVQLGLHAALGLVAATALCVWLARARQWVWRVPFVFFSASALAFFFEVFGGLEPNTPGLLSDGQYHAIDVVVLVLCILAAAACGVAAWRRERSPSRGGLA